MSEMATADVQRHHAFDSLSQPWKVPMKLPTVCLSCCMDTFGSSRDNYEHRLSLLDRPI